MCNFFIQTLCTTHTGYQLLLFKEQLEEFKRPASTLDNSSKALQVLEASQLWGDKTSIVYTSVPHGWPHTSCMTVGDRSFIAADDLMP